MLRLSDNEELFKTVAKAISRTTKKYNEYIEVGEIDEEDLKRVKKLDLYCESLQGIEQLTSLTKLSINYNPQNSTESYEETIGRLDNLKRMKIIGNHNMLINLQHNPKLRNILIAGENCRVSGAENLECLNNGRGRLSLHLSGTAILENMEGLVCKSNKKNVKKIVLPLLSLAEEKSKNPNILQVLNENKANILFTTYHTHDYMTIPETIELDKEMTKIKNELQLSDRDKDGKIIKTYEYLCENFTYAEKEASRENSSYSSIIRKDKIRSTSQVLKNKRGVCASFSNIFNYILQSEGIKSLPVHGKCDNSRDGAHQLSKVCMDNNEWAYYDPTWGMGFGGNVDWRFFHMSKQKVNSYCKLSEREDSYKSAKDTPWSELREKIELESMPIFQRNIKSFTRNEEGIGEKGESSTAIRIKDSFEEEK